MPEPTPAPEPEPEPLLASLPSPPPAAPVESAGPAAAALPPVTAWLVVVDDVVEHRAASAGGTSAFTFLGARHLDRDLAAFAGGSLHVRLQVRSKPTADPVRYQICLVPQDIRVSPACTAPERLEVTSAGSFTLDQRLDALSGAAALDWAQGIQQVMLVLRQPDGTPIDDRLLPGQTSRSIVDPARYYPMDVRVSAVLVAPGGAFPGWQ